MIVFAMPQRMIGHLVTEFCHLVIWQKKKIFFFFARKTLTAVYHQQNKHLKQLKMLWWHSYVLNLKL